MSGRVAIAIVGDYRGGEVSHAATNAALRHAAERAGVALESSWVATTRVARDPEVLTAFDGIWAAPASPYASSAGALAGIRFARERGWPFFAT